MVLIALYTGFRPQELALIEVKNVILNEDKIVGGMKTENGKDREIPIHPMIKPLIEKRYSQAIDRFHSDRLFNDPRGQVSTKMTYDMYRGRFKNVMVEMGFVGFTPHCTRHTFSTQAKRCGMDSGIRKRIMGHSLVGDITESVYTHPSFEDLKTEMNKKLYKSRTNKKVINRKKPKGKHIAVSFSIQYNRGIQYRGGSP